jgi:putrescine transport system permease protein
MNNNIFNKYRKFIVTPSIIWVSLFTIAALLLLAYISFCSPEFGVIPYKSFIQLTDETIEIKPDFSSYKILFIDSFYLKALINSIAIATIATFCTLLVGYPMAYMIANSNHRLFLLILIITPFWTALLIRVYGWIILLKDNGLINQFLLYLGIINQPIEFLNSKAAIIVGIVYTYLPFMILPIYTSLIKIKQSIIEAASDLGAKPYSIFCQIIFPLSLPGVITGIILVLIPAIGEFVIPDLLGGAKTITIGKLLWTEFFMNRDWPMACAITILIILLVVLPIKLLYRAVSNNQN